MKSIFLLSTFFLISCGQEPTLETSQMTPTVDSTLIPGHEKDASTVIATSRTETLESQADPSEVALKFINSYADNSNKMKEAIGVRDWVNSSDLVTQNFRDELNRILDEAYRDDPELGLDADPIFDAQHNPNKFVLESADGDYLTVRGEEWPEFKLKMKVDKSAHKWLVDGCGMINIPTDRRIGR